MRKTTYWLPKGGLLVEAREVLTDNRLGALLVEKAISLAPSGGRAKGDDESDLAYAQRVWRGLLPSRDSRDIENLREEQGWTAEEAHQVIRLLSLCANELERQSIDVVLNGTRMALLRDAEQIRNQVIPKWAAIPQAEQDLENGVRRAEGCICRMPPMGRRRQWGSSHEESCPWSKEV